MDDLYFPLLDCVYVCIYMCVQVVESIGFLRRSPGQVTSTEMS